jgi:hypothetical protein
MMYENKESIKARLKAQIASSSKESLQEWRAPFVHMGGSGTFYPMRDSSTEELMPKFRTGYSMGPFSQQISGVQDLIQEDMRCKIPGYEGDFFDPNDVEGYLRGRGIYIPPAADFVTAELDLSELASSKSSAISESEMSALSPKTPEPLGNTALLDPSSFSYNYDFSRPECKAFPFPLGYADWEDNSTIKEASNLNPIFSTMQVTPFDRSKLTPGPALSERIFTEKRVVTVNVNVLLEGESSCLCNYYIILTMVPTQNSSDVLFVYIGPQALDQTMLTWQSSMPLKPLFSAWPPLFWLRLAFGLVLVTVMLNFGSNGCLKGPKVP